MLNQGGQRPVWGQTRSFHPDVANVKRDKELHPHLMFKSWNWIILSLVSLSQGDLVQITKYSPSMKWASWDLTKDMMQGLTQCV